MKRGRDGGDEDKLKGGEEVVLKYGVLKKVGGLKVSQSIGARIPIEGFKVHPKGRGWR